MVVSDRMSPLVCSVLVREREFCNGRQFYVRIAKSQQTYTCVACGEVYDNITPPSGETKDG